MNEDDSDGKMENSENREREIQKQEKENKENVDEIQVPDNIDNTNSVESVGSIDENEDSPKTDQNPEEEENSQVDESQIHETIRTIRLEESGSIAVLTENDHPLELSNKALKLQPQNAKNGFIKRLIEKLVEESGRFSEIRKKFQNQLKSNTFLSVCKYDEAFIELCLSEICSSSEKSSAGLEQLIKEYLGKGPSDFFLIAGDFKQFVNLCLLHLVENNFKPLCLRKFLDWYFSLHSLGFIKDEWKKWINEMKKPFDVQIEIYINEALIQACKLGKHEIVFQFLNKGFQIYDKDFKSCDVSELERKEHRKRLLENRFNQRHLKIFRATSTPTYQIAHFFYINEKYENQSSEKNRMLLNADIFSQTLHNVKIAMNLSVDEYDLAEYNNQLQKIINAGRNFLGDLISRCETLEEAKLLLSHDYLLDHYALEHETTEWQYHRLDEACLSRHKYLVTHDFSQRIFRETWQKSANLQNVKSGVMKKVISNVILTPLYVLFYLVAYIPISNFGSLDSSGNLLLEAKLEPYPLLQDLFFHFSAPINRCISDFISHLWLIALILLTMINPYDEKEILDVEWYDVCLAIWAFGFCIKCSREALYFLNNFFFSGSGYKKAHWKRSIQGIRDIYKVLQFLCCILVLLGMIFKFIGFHCSHPWNSESCTLEKEKDNSNHYCDDTYLKTGYSLIGVGATLCILNIIHFFEFNSYLGPIILSLRQTAGDILKILTTFVVFLVAFSVGLHFSLKFSNMYCEGEYEKIVERRKYDAEFNCTQDRVETNLKGFILEDDVNHFREFRESIKTCFWSLFDPGHPEVIGCTQGPPRHLGMFLWGTYQIINVVIVMNLLIALMNATIAGIQEDKITEWRFARTQIWRQYFDHYKISHLPVPFNLLEMMMNLAMKIIKRLMRYRRGNSDNSEVPLKELGEAGIVKEVEEEQKQYLDLVGKLCARYIQMKKRKEERRENTNSV